MLQDAVHREEWSQPEVSPEEIEYVPNVFCPNCKAVIRVPSETYAWYDGEVPCGACWADVHVKIGDYRPAGPGHEPIPTTRGGIRGSAGGILLSTPRLIRTRGIPAEFQAGTGSESIPLAMRESSSSAGRGFEVGLYAQVAVECRSTIEAALLDRGVQGKTPANMIEAAIQNELLQDPYEKYPRIVVASGGRGAHPAREPVTREEALLVIGLTAALLRKLYEVEN